MLQPLRYTVAGLVLAIVGAPAGAQDATDQPVPEQTPAQFIDTDGNVTGGANLTDGAGGGVLINVQLQNMPAGQQLAFHVHENGECDPETGFESAGGHFNPEGREHGFHAEGGHHAGDMPNLYVPESGEVLADIHNAAVGLESEPSVRGRALVVHSGPDDYASQPSGDAGDRLACAVIE